MSNELVVSGSSFTPAVETGGVMPSADGPEFMRTYSPERKAEIERIRDTDINRYFAEGLDRELLAMMREDTGEVGPTDPMPVETSRSLMSETPEGARLVMDWERMGGFRHQLAQIQKTVGGMVRDLGGAREQRVFMERFDRALPEPIRYAIYNQLAMGVPSFVVPVEKAQVDEFARHEVGADLVREWGSDAPETIAKIWKRMDNLRAAIGDDFELFSDWFNNLDKPQMRRVLQFIAYGA